MNSESTELSKLVEICHVNLKNSSELSHYLTQVRSLNSKTIQKYQLGYFPQNTAVLREYVDEEILKNKRILDFFGGSKFAETHSLIIPIYDEYHNIIGINGRTLLNDEQRSVLGIPKYESSSYKKSNYLYGLNHARSHILKAQNCYVVEGNFDCISMSEAGIQNTVAICGTAFSRNHFFKLARYTDMITFILDRDDGGINSMKRIQNKYSNRGIKIRTMLIPKGYKDVDEYLKDPFNSGDSLLHELEALLFDWV